MYNVTPHGVTGKSPSELMFGRRIRDKIPGIDDLMQCAEDGEAKDADMINKQKGKDREDTSRGAKPTIIEVGDRVLVQNLTRSNKLESRFQNKEFEVIQKNGNEAILAREGKTLRRHVTHLKKVPSSDEVTQPDLLISESAAEPTILDNNPQPDKNAPSTGSQAEEEQGPEQRHDTQPKVPILKLKRMEGLWRPA